MKLEFIGNGAAFNPVYGNNAAYLREGNRMLLIDCGGTVFSQLVCKKILDGVESMDICLTHLHGDHAGSLETTIMYCFHALGFRCRLILPEDVEYQESVVNLLELMHCTDDSYTIASPSEVIEYEAFSSMEYVKTLHSEGMRAFSIIFETKGGGVFYSGDTNTDEQLKEFLETHPTPEIMYIDSSDGDGSYHLNINTISAAVPEELRNRVSMMHISSQNCVFEGIRLGFSFGNERKLGNTKGKLEMQEYDPAWAVIGSNLVELIKSIMGSDARDVQHVGSTSIPGMFAKPIIDICISVDDYSVLDRHIDEFAANKIVYNGEMVPGQRELSIVDEESGNRWVHIHVVKTDMKNMKAYCAIRDYCIANPSARDAYILLKKALLLRYPDNPEKYGPAKHVFMDDLEKDAFKWQETVLVSKQENR